MLEFSSEGWESWGVERRPLIPERMPILIDEDLRFESEPGVARPAMVANRWLRELPVSGGPAVRTWKIYAQVLRAWLEFLTERGVDAFGSRERLRAALGAYAEHRLAGPLNARWDRSTWNLHVNVLSQFYRWAEAEGHATAVPFTYKGMVRVADGQLRDVQRNTAKLRPAKRHSTIKYLEKDFADLFLKALAGLCPDGSPDESFRGRDLGRNAAMGRLVMSTGLRRRELTYLLVYEVPPLPARRTAVPVPFPLGRAVTKGGKQRTTWIDYDALAEVHQYISLDRAAAAEGFVYQPAQPLMVERPDGEGARINGRRRPWRALSPQERLRLVSPEGGCCLVALQSWGGPFVDWPTVFRRTSRRIQCRFEPRFPIVSAHRLRHTFALSTLEMLVSGYYRQAARLVKDTDENAGLALYLTQADPLEVLRDLLGHSSVTTTEVYLRRLDTTRIYRDAYTRAGCDAGLSARDVAAEVYAEFDEEGDVGCRRP
jgi:integrase